MKLWFLFLALIGTAGVCRAEAQGPGLGPVPRPSRGGGVEFRPVGRARSIVIGVIDPCKRPHPPPGCQNPSAPRTPAHGYTRPCSKINRCRGGPPRREAISVWDVVVSEGFYMYSTGIKIATTHNNANFANEFLSKLRMVRPFCWLGLTNLDRKFNFCRSQIF